MSKTTLADKKSIFAASFNATAAILAGTSDETPEVDDIIEMAVELYEARLAAQEDLGITGDEGKASSGGRGKSGGRSGGSKRSSGGSSGPSRGQIDFASDLIDQIEDNGDEPSITLREFKALSKDDASDMIDELKEEAGR